MRQHFQKHQYCKEGVRNCKFGKLTLKRCQKLSKDFSDSKNLFKQCYEASSN